MILIVGLHHDRVHYDFKVRLSDSKRKFTATRAYRDASRSTNTAVIIMSSSATPRKRSCIDENYHTPARTPHAPRRDIFRTPLQPLPTPVNTINFTGFVDGHTPVPKRRKVAREVTQDELTRLGSERRAREVAEGLRKQEEEREQRRQEEQLRREAAELKLRSAMQDLRTRGYPTLFSFIDAFLQTKDPILSSQVSRMIGVHGPSLLAGFEIRQPEIVHDWAISTHRKLVDLESIALANHFKPRKGASITSILDNFSIHQFLASENPSQYIHHTREAGSRLAKL